MDDWQPEHIQVVGFILTAIASAIMIVKRANLIPTALKAWRKTFGRTHHRIETNLEKFGKTLSEVAKEVKPNGRGSIQHQLAEIHDVALNSVDLLDVKVHADHVPNFRTDAEGLVTSVNLRYQQITGFGKDRLLGHGWIIVVEEKERDRVLDLWRRVVEEKREITVTLPCERPDGTKHKMEVEVHRIFNSKTGEIRGYFGVVHPVDA